KNPPRLVLDLPEVELGTALAQLPRLVRPSDPYIAAIRVATYRAGGVRVVLDLKSEVNPQLFALNPVAAYGYGVVLDLYPLTPPDPLMALLESERRRSPEVGRGDTPSAVPAPEPAPATPPGDSRRPIVVMIDPGHGGEDPGAVGKRGTYEKQV